MSTNEAPNAADRGSALTEGLGPTLDLLNKEMPRNPPWGEGQYVSVYAVHKLLAAQRERHATLCESMAEPVRPDEMQSQAQWIASACAAAIRRA